MEKIKIFVSYSHQNEDWILKDGKYKLIPWLERQLEGQAEIWTDHALKRLIGEEYTMLITEKITDADIAILLISQDFVSSQYIMDVELPLIRQQYKSDKLKILPLLITDLTKKGKEKISWIFDLQTYPNDTKPLIDFVGNDAEWAKIKVEILDGVENKIEDIWVRLSKKQKQEEENSQTKTDAEGKQKQEKQRLESGNTHINKRGKSKKIFISIIVIIVLLLLSAIIYFIINTNETVSQNEIELTKGIQEQVSNTDIQKIPQKNTATEIPGKSTLSSTKEITKKTKDIHSDTEGQNIKKNSEPVKAKKTNEPEKNSLVKNIAVKDDPLEKQNINQDDTSSIDLTLPNKPESIIKNKPERTSAETKVGTLTIHWAGRFFAFDCKTLVYINNSLNSYQSTKKGFKVVVPIDSEIINMDLMIKGLGLVRSTEYELRLDSHKSYIVEIKYDDLLGKYAKKYTLLEINL